ncbi:hypothetical protein MP228_013148 [Amoeboaphelidium protococcarum]|nr:hypothetical protein MP228_013148 [Amoeboaphelidium protococcarum]
MEFTQLFKQSRQQVRQLLKNDGSKLLVCAYNDSVVVRNFEDCSIASVFKCPSVVTNVDVCGQIILCWSTKDNWVQVFTATGKKCGFINNVNVAKCELLPNSSTLLVYSGLGVRIQFIHLMAKENRSVKYIPHYNSIKTSKLSPNSQYLAFIQMRNAVAFLVVLNVENMTVISSTELIMDVVDLQWSRDSTSITVVDMHSFKTVRIDGVTVANEEIQLLTSLTEYTLVKGLTWAANDQLLVAYSLSTISVISPVTWSVIYSVNIADEQDDSIRRDEAVLYKMKEDGSGLYRGKLSSSRPKQTKQYEPALSSKLYPAKNSNLVAFHTECMPKIIHILDLVEMQLLAVCEHSTRIEIKSIVWNDREQLFWTCEGAAQIFDWNRSGAQMTEIPADDFKPTKIELTRDGLVLMDKDKFSVCQV